MSDDLMLVEMMVMGSIDTLTNTAEIELCECCINPSYISVIEPALMHEGFVYAIIDGEERLIKGSVQGLRTKIREHRLKSLTGLN